MLTKTVLPPKSPEETIVCPTMNRWTAKDETGKTTKGPLVNMLDSVVSKLQNQGNLGSTQILLSDATETQSGMHDARDAYLKEITRDRPNTEMYLMTRDTQKEVVDMLKAKTGIEAGVLEAIIELTGYASQRAKLDVVVAGQALGTGETKKILSLDDDTVIPDQRRTLHIERLDNKFAPEENSQALLPYEPGNDFFSFSPNRLSAFFESLGLTVAQFRQDFRKTIRSSYGMHDTMHETLEHAVAEREKKSTESFVQQFIVRENHLQLEDSDNAKIVAAVSTKYGVPDYRTVKIFAANMNEEFPENEVNMVSYPSGKNSDFVFQRSWTNVDSACISRLFDQMTAQLPWWFISDVEISKKNPLQVVTAHYRADNEFLPVLFEQIKKSAGQNFVYHGGIDTQVSHHRARNGYRPGLIEQATASLVGNVAALEAIKYIEFFPDKPPSFMQFNRDIFLENLSHTRVYDVYRSLETLLGIAKGKYDEIRERLDRDNDGTRIQQNIQKLVKCEAVINLLHRKTGGFNYHAFKESIVDEVYNQLVFYKKVITAFPTVILAVSDIIQKGQYPVEKVTPSSRSFHMSDNKEAHHLGRKLAAYQPTVK